MHRLIGPTQTDWRDGMKRMVQTLAPQLLKK
jgi:UDP-glucuronate 4-epimerase